VLTGHELGDNPAASPPSAGWTYDGATPAGAQLPRPTGAAEQPGAAVWAGDRPVVVGGVHDDRGYTVRARSRHAWISAAGAALGRSRR
jgi:hypothetical protein